MSDFDRYVMLVGYFAGRPLTTEEILFEVSEAFNRGWYCEQTAESLLEIA